MELKHVKIYSGDKMEARRIKNFLDENGISAVIKEDTIVAYEISNNLAEVHVLNIDKEQALKILDKSEI